MKILVSAYDCAPDRGSEAGIGWNWCLHLARSGEDVRVITQSANRPAIEAFLTKAAVPNLTLSYVPTMQVPPLMERVYGFWYLVYINWQARILRVARQLDREIGFDAVHHVSWGSLQLGSQLWRLRKPFFYGPVGGGQTAPAALRGDFAEQWRIERVRNFVVRYMSGAAFGAGRAISEARTVFVTNKETGDLVRSMGAARVQFLWDSAVPDGWLKPDPPAAPQPGPLRLIWVGTLIRRKGICLALDTMAALQGRCDATLTVIGDGPDRGLLEAAVAARGLDDVVTVRGRLAWEEVRNAYDAHHVLLFTSLRESLGMQLFEGLARGCAVVCLDLHGAATLISDTCGVKVAVTDRAQIVDDLSRAIVALDRDRDRLATLRAGARRVAAGCDWPSKVSIARDAYKLQA